MTLEEKLESVRKRFDAGMISSYEKETEELNLRFGTEELRQTDEYLLNKLRIEKDYGKVSQYDYDMRSAEILYKNASPTDRNIALLDVQRKNGVIDKEDYLCKVKELNDEPYAAIHIEYDTKNNDEMQVIVKNNKSFVRHLKSLGFEGETEEEIIDGWVKMRLASIAQSEEYNIEPYNDVAFIDEDLVC